MTDNCNIIFEDFSERKITIRKVRKERKERKVERRIL
jgi:hypothetical protein